MIKALGRVEAFAVSLTGFDIDILKETVSMKGRYLYVFLEKSVRSDSDDTVKWIQRVNLFQSIYGLNGCVIFAYLAPKNKNDDHDDYICYFVKVNLEKVIVKELRYIFSGCENSFFVYPTILDKNLFDIVWGAIAFLLTLGWKPEDFQKKFKLSNSQWETFTKNKLFVDKVPSKTMSEDELKTLMR